MIWIKEATSSTKVFGPSKEGEGGTKEKEGMISRLWHTDGGKWKMGTINRNNLKNNLFALESDFWISVIGYRAIVLYKEHIVHYCSPLIAPMNNRKII